MELDWLKRWALYSPEKHAFKDVKSGTAVTYDEFHRRSCRLAHALKERFGVGKGDRVAVLSKNEIETVYLFFALQRLGAILVPINFRLTPSEVEHPLSDAGPRLLAYGEDSAFPLEKLDPGKIPELRIPITGPSSIASLIADPRLPDSPGEFLGELKDPCMILYTSGTTGFPKGALITNEMVFWNSVNTTLRLDLRQDDSTLGFLPFFHTGAWNVLALPLFHRGGTVVYLEKFDEEAVLRACQSERISILFGVPTTLDRIARAPGFGDADFSSLRFAVVGGEAMREELILTWENKGVRIRQGYGLTEFGPNVFSLSERDSRRKIGSIGFPNFYVQAKLVDEIGKPIHGEGTGELALHGPMCTPGYWKNPEATAETLRDGWFYTGDLLRRDSEGYYYVVGRKKEMYISGAENVYPAEIERVILEHPQVREAAVTGVPDEQWGEVGKAFIALERGQELSAEQILAHCRRSLAGYKIPRHVKFVDEIPKGENGKILKRQLQSLE